MADRPSGSLLTRLLSPFAQLRDGEATTAFLMFAYSFLAMTSYNIVKPITRSQFIASLGADNLPWVQFGSGVLIGVVMQLYSRAIASVPRRWTIPITQAGMVVLLVVFWLLFTAANAEWVSVAFYFLGLILGLLLISQFWTLANDVYDPRQAKRLFGFIGGGSSLGGATGAAMTRFLVEKLGTTNMLLVSAATLAGCLAIVMVVLRRESHAGQADYSKTGEEEGVGGSEALKLLSQSRHLQIIALVIAFAAIGAAIIEQQLNMATAAEKTSTDAITAFLAEITIYLSLAGLAVQVLLTSRIHRYLGIGFALLILPTGLGTTGVIMLLNAGLWAPSLARVLDTALRYTVDKTTREILFLPLPPDLKYRAKPFVDVTVDRFAKGIGALLLLVLIKGLHLSWQQLSWASLGVTALWIGAALRARREYLLAFRRSIEEQHVEAEEIRLDTADLSSIETLVQELGHPDPQRVVYAIDLLEALDKRSLVTPLLLNHGSPLVRARALRVAEAAGPAGAPRWAASADHALKDPDGDVRQAAVRAIAAIRREGAADIMRPYLHDADPHLVVTAAAALSSSPAADDVDAAEAAFRRLIDDSRDQAADVRLDAARALGQVTNPRFRPLLVPLIYDSNLSVAREAVLSAGRLGAGDFLFVPALVSLLRHRRLKSTARQVLIGYGDGVVDPLVYFLHDKDEDPWIRRHLPSTLALIPTQRSMDVLLAALDDGDGFVRYKAGAAIERLRRDHPALVIDPAIIERQVLVETTRAFSALTLHHNLFVAGGAASDDCLLARALTEKHQRARRRVFRLLSLIHDPGDIHAVEQALQRGDARTRSSALEYLDNLLAGAVRRRVMLLVEDMPADERIRRGNVLYKTRVRDVEDTVVQLVHDEDQVIAASAIHFVEERGMWALAGDLEHVLQHRDAHDWYVFEAASWALAARRLSPERRRALWLEPLPAVEMADRLRHIRLFDFVSVAELFRFAGLGRQVRHEAGRALYEQGTAPAALQFLLDGRLTVTAADGSAAQTLTPPCPLAFGEVLEGGVMESTIRAAETSICLSLTADEFLSMLSENVELAQGIFRLLLETRGPKEWRTVMHGRLAPEMAQRVGADGLQPIDRVLLLQLSPILGRATATELLRLAGAARPTPLRRGTDPFGGTAEPSLLLVLKGAVAVDREDGVSDVAEAGDAIGIYETLGGAAISAKAQVTEDGSALRWRRSDLFDLLADHIDLLQAIYSGLLRTKIAPHEHDHTPAGP